MKTMTPTRRELFLRVMDGYPDLRHLFVYWNQHSRCDQVLHWLIKHHYTGRRLADLFKHRFGPRIWLPYQWVLDKLDNKN